MRLLDATVALATSLVGPLAVAFVRRGLRARTAPTRHARDVFSEWAIAHGRTLRHHRGGLAALGPRSCVTFSGDERVGVVRVAALGARHVASLRFEDEPPMGHRIDDAVRDVERRADLALGRQSSYR